MMVKTYILFSLLVSFHVSAQIDTIIVTLDDEIEQPGFNFTYSSLIDRNNGDFVYSAAHNQGLIAYEILPGNQLVPIDTLDISFFDGQAVCSLIQEDSLLYVGMGDLQKALPVKTGAAVVNINDPYNMSVISYWDTTGLENGTAVLRKEGDYLYLGCMEEGIAIMNAADPLNLQLMSTYLPDTLWPGIVNYSPNARGMEVRNDTMYLAFDAGGLRIIDLADKYNPVEIAHYVNPDLFTLPASPAYNNIVLKDGLAYITIDYCGFEVVDISDPNNIQRLDWYNPWGCTNATGYGTPGSWFGSLIHANEIVLSNNDSLLFVSGGDQELWVFALENPSSPRFVGQYAIAPDSIVAWGIDVFDGKIVSSCVDNSAVIWPFNLVQPYFSDWGGIKLFSTNIVLSSPELSEIPGVSIQPNPSNGEVIVECPGLSSANLYNIEGTLIDHWKFENSIRLNNEGLPSGLYILHLENENGAAVLKMVHQ